MAGRSFGRKKNYGLTITVSSKPWCFVWMREKRNHPLSNKTGSLILNKTKTAISTKRIDFYHHKGLGCAFRFVFRFIPVLIFRNSGYSAEFPEFRGTHVGIKSFHGKINLHRNSGSGIPDPEFRREGPLTWYSVNTKKQVSSMAFCCQLLLLPHTAASRYCCRDCCHCLSRGSSGGAGVAAWGGGMRWRQR